MQCLQIRFQKSNYNIYWGVKMTLYVEYSTNNRISMIIMLMAHSLREALPHQKCLNRIVDNTC